MKACRLRVAGRAWLSEALLLGEALLALSIYTALPVVWFRVAARVQEAGRGLGLASALIGYAATASLALLLLRALDKQRRHLLAVRGIDAGDYNLPERLIVWQTVALVVLLGIWFVFGRYAPGAFWRRASTNPNPSRRRTSTSTPMPTSWKNTAKTFIQPCCSTRSGSATLVVVSVETAK